MFKTIITLFLSPIIMFKAIFCIKGPNILTVHHIVSRISDDQHVLTYIVIVISTLVENNSGSTCSGRWWRGDTVEFAVEIICFYGTKVTGLALFRIFVAETFAHPHLLLCTPTNWTSGAAGFF